MDETTGLALPAEAGERALEEGRLWENVAGGLVLAIVSFAVVLYSAYHGWYAGDLSKDWAYAGIGFGFMFFALGAFVFAYGWERGDMQKAVRLTFFICVLMLAAILAIVVLLKSKGAAAKEAGSVGSAASSAASGGDFNPLPVLNAVGSMLMSGAEDGEAAPDSMEDIADRPFQIKCRGCGASYAPTPPAAKCPFCNEAALAV